MILGEARGFWGYLIWGYYKRIFKTNYFLDLFYLGLMKVFFCCDVILI